MIFSLLDHGMFWAIYVLDGAVLLFLIILIIVDLIDRKRKK